MWIYFVPYFVVGVLVACGYIYIQRDQLYYDYEDIGGMFLVVTTLWPAWVICGTLWLIAYFVGAIIKEVVNHR